MAIICKSCRLANPREATYCHHDGVLLEGRGGGEAPVDGSAINIGGRPFVRPFVFPSGRACHTFNDLALACHADPAAALDVLRKGLLETFFATLGRADLAVAARAADRAADRERGLDEFLGRLPAPALGPARLRVEPAALDLGTMRLGEDRRVEMVLHNDGMRLLYGSASSDSPWLVLGDGAAQPRKVFQFPRRMILPVRVLGRLLRASPRPQQATIQVESSGGTVAVTVRLQANGQPFPEGVLAGALSPRQLAEKAHAAPREAAALLESGAVARWYAANGWVYPVVGPTAPGVAAVQQLLEALGLVKPPPVEVSEESIRLQGAPGQTIEHVLAVVAQENRAAVAHATSDQPWLRVGATVFRGRTACLPLRVSVPNRPGELLGAQIAVTANGGQRFLVPVTLTVAPAPLPAAPAAAAPPPAAPAPAPAAPPPAAPAPAPAVGILVPPRVTQPPPKRPRTRRASPAGRGRFLALAALAFVLLVVAGVATLHWYLSPGGRPVRAPILTLAFQDDPRDEVLGTATMTFGLTLAAETYPGNPQKHKSLIGEEKGRTSNTCYRVDGEERLLGYEGGHWEPLREPLGFDGKRERQGCRSVWLHQAAPVAIVQQVEIVTGPQSHARDTCLVRYTIENRDKAAHKVGLRVLLDTFVGTHDGVPFAVPGLATLCDTSCDRQGADVPDFLQALETDDLKKPGVVAQLGLRLSAHLEPPGRVTLGAWPDDALKATNPLAQGNLTRWEVPLLSLKQQKDAAATLYWLETDIAPGARRELGFSYGLGTLAAEGDGRLALALGGVFAPGGEFTVAAYMKDATPGETLTLVLPAGLTLVSGQATANVAPAPQQDGPSSLVAWRVRSLPGTQTSYRLQVSSRTGRSQSCTVAVQANREFE